MPQVGDVSGQDDALAAEKTPYSRVRGLAAAMLVLADAAAAAGFARAPHSVVFADAAAAAIFAQVPLSLVLANTANSAVFARAPLSLVLADAAAAAVFAPAPHSLVLADAAAAAVSAIILQPLVWAQPERRGGPPRSSPLRGQARGRQDGQHDDAGAHGLGAVPLLKDGLASVLAVD